MTGDESIQHVQHIYKLQREDDINALQEAVPIKQLAVYVSDNIQTMVVFFDLFHRHQYSLGSLNLSGNTTSKSTQFFKGRIYPTVDPFDSGSALMTLSFFELAITHGVFSTIFATKESRLSFTKVSLSTPDNNPFGGRAIVLIHKTCHHLEVFSAEELI
ncbi:hypothetical protein BGW39_011172 [Mortierella sp. 14UC]|nr:hypothetical protein BGW39_011172 [Mortierella sp. 14UC]